MAGLELGRSVEHQNGRYPSVCVNDRNTVVQVVNQWGLGNDLRYYVGKIERRGDISWAKAEQYDFGLYPRVAINNSGTVVEVHQSQAFRDIYTTVGVVDTDEKTINWGKAQRCDKGTNAAVALLDDGTVVCVYLTDAVGSYSTYYRVGSADVQNKSIDWGNTACYGRGREVAVAATGESGVVVEVHKSVWGNSLFYKLGKLQSSRKQILWGEDIYYDGGWAPSVALNSDGYVLECHTTVTLRRLYCRTGVVKQSDSEIKWVYDSQQYDMGMYPSVSLNGNDNKNVVEAHESNFGLSIWCRNGTLKK